LFLTSDASGVNSLIGELSRLSPLPGEVRSEELLRFASKWKLGRKQHVDRIPAYADSIIPRVAQKLLKYRPAVHLSPAFVGGGFAAA